MNQETTSRLRNPLHVLTSILCISLSIGWLMAPDLVRRGRNAAISFLRVRPEPLPLDLSANPGPVTSFRVDSAKSLPRLASLAAPEKVSEEGHLLRAAASHTSKVQ